MFTTVFVTFMALLRASALIVPPSTALNSTPAFPLANTVQDPFSIKLLAPCQGCLSAHSYNNEQGSVWAEGIDGSLYLNVAVNNKLNLLELNGAQIYPPPSSRLDLDLLSPQVSQLPSTVSLKDAISNPENYLDPALTVTSWILHSTTLHSLKQTGEEIVRIEIAINAIEHEPINVPIIVVMALKNSGVQLTLLSVNLENTPSRSPCQSMSKLCHLRKLIYLVFNSVTLRTRPSCHKSWPHYISAAEQHKEDEINQPEQDAINHQPIGHGRHQIHDPSRQNHHQHDGIGFLMHQIGRIILNIAIPLMLGILAGMATYGAGLLLGTLAVFVWNRYRRYQSVPLGNEESSSPSSFYSDEKYQDYEDAPDALPAYKNTLDDENEPENEW